MRTINKTDFNNGSTVGRMVVNERVKVIDSFGKEIPGTVVNLTKRDNGKVRARILTFSYTMVVDVLETFPSAHHAVNHTYLDTMGA